MNDNFNPNLRILTLLRRKFLDKNGEKRDGDEKIFVIRDENIYISPHSFPFLPYSINLIY